MQSVRTSKLTAIVPPLNQSLLRQTDIINSTASSDPTWQINAQNPISTQRGIQTQRKTGHGGPPQSHIAPRAYGSRLSEIRQARLVLTHQKQCKDPSPPSSSNATHKHDQGKPPLLPSSSSCEAPLPIARGHVKPPSPSRWSSEALRHTPCAVKPSPLFPCSRLATRPLPVVK